MAAPPPRFLADESCDFGAVRALRATSYDVVAVSESATRSIDSEIIERAAREGRILLTEDKDFGWLVFASHANSPGVILVRFPGNARQTLATALVQVVQEHGEKLVGAFVVVEPGRARVSRRLTSQGQEP